MTLSKTPSSTSRFGSGIVWGLTIGIAGLYLLSTHKGKSLKNALLQLEDKFDFQDSDNPTSDPAIQLNQLISHPRPATTKLNKQEDLNTARSTLDQLTQRLNKLFESSDPEPTPTPPPTMRFTKSGKTLSK